MHVKVVDASAVAALVFAEPEAKAISVRLRKAVLSAPALLSFELASVCLKKLRRYPEQRETLLTAHRLVKQMAVKYVDVEQDEVVVLAEKTGLTVYDAAYLMVSANTSSRARYLGRDLVASSKIIRLI